MRTVGGGEGGFSDDENSSVLVVVSGCDNGSYDSACISVWSGV